MDYFLAKHFSSQPPDPSYNHFFSPSSYKIPKTGRCRRQRLPKQQFSLRRLINALADLMNLASSRCSKSYPSRQMKVTCEKLETLSHAIKVSAVIYVDHFFERAGPLDIAAVDNASQLWREKKPLTTLQHETFIKKMLPILLVRAQQHPLFLRWGRCYFNYILDTLRELHVYI